MPEDIALFIDFENIRYSMLNIQRREPDPQELIAVARRYGTVMVARAYADWSAPVNADYRGQLVSRAVDLVQLFPAAVYAKNGADIRLAVDAVDKPRP